MIRQSLSFPFLKQMRQPTIRVLVAIAALGSLGAPAFSQEKITNPIAVFSGLDKITGRITTFDVYI
ncbi:MAG: DUF2155 domain-containing protein, partial [Phyllobacterium sp.]